MDSTSLSAAALPPYGAAAPAAALARTGVRFGVAFGSIPNASTEYQEYVAALDACFRRTPEGGS